MAPRRWFLIMCWRESYSAMPTGSAMCHSVVQVGISSANWMSCNGQTNLRFVENSLGDQYHWLSTNCARKRSMSRASVPWGAGSHIRIPKSPGISCSLPVSDRNDWRWCRDGLPLGFQSPLLAAQCSAHRLCITAHWWNAFPASNSANYAPFSVPVAISFPKGDIQGGSIIIPSQENIAEHHIIC